MLIDSEKRSDPIRILLLDNHTIVRDGLRMIIDGNVEFVVVAEAADGATAIRLVSEHLPDVVLMDFCMPAMDSFDVIASLHHSFPHMAIVVLTTYDDDDLRIRALSAGATNYLLKDISRGALFQSLRAAVAGETLLPARIMLRLLKQARYSLHVKKPAVRVSAFSQQSLTERELDVLMRVVQGERNKDIAIYLSISEPTVKAHLASIYAKLGVNSRAAAVAVVVEKGLVSLSGSICSLSPF